MTENLKEDLNATIANAVKARVEAEVLAALSGDEVFGRYVMAALNQPVEVPKPGSSYDKVRVPFLHNLLTKAIQSATTTAVTKLIEEEMPTIEGEVRKVLRKNVDALAAGMATSLIDWTKKGHGIKVDVQLKMPEVY